MRYLYICLFSFSAISMQAQHNKWVALPAVQELVKVHDLRIRGWDISYGPYFEPQLFADSLFVSPGKDSVKIHLRYLSSLACFDTADLSNYQYYGSVKDTATIGWNSKLYLKKIFDDSVFVYRYYYKPEAFIPLKKYAIVKVSGNLDKYRRVHTINMNRNAYWSFGDKLVKVKKEEKYRADTLKHKMPPCGGIWLTLPLKKTIGLHISNFFVEIKYGAIQTIDFKKKIFFNTDYFNYDATSRTWHVEYDASNPDFWVGLRNFGTDTLRIRRCTSSKGFSSATYRYDYIPPGQWLSLTFSFDEEAIKSGERWTGYYALEFDGYEKRPEMICYELKVKQEK